MSSFDSFARFAIGLAHWVALSGQAFEAVNATAARVGPQVGSLPDLNVVR